MFLKKKRSPLAAAVVFGSLIAVTGCALPPKPESSAAYPELMAAGEEKKAAGADAFPFWERAAKADPSKKEPWLRMAQSQFDARNYGAAITSSQEVLQRDNTDATAMSILAVSGIRVATSALDQLRQANAIGGSTKEEAQSLARTIHSALGEPILAPAAAASAPAETSTSRAQAHAKPFTAKASPANKAATAKPAVVKPVAATTPTAAPSSTSSAQPSSAAGGKYDPFKVLNASKP